MLAYEKRTTKHLCQCGLYAHVMWAQRLLTAAWVMAVRTPVFQKVREVSGRLRLYSCGYRISVLRCRTGRSNSAKHSTGPAVKNAL